MPARTFRLTIGTGVVAVAMSAWLAAQTATQIIVGGTFEASGVAYVPGTAGVLFVDDARNRDVFWLELGSDGRQRSAAQRVALGADVTDLEGITFDGSRFYVVGSQSKRTGFAGDGLVRFRFDPQTRTTSDVERIRGVKSWLADNVPELKGTARILGDEALNIEAIAWDPERQRLLLGLRAPVVNGAALVIPVKLQNPAGAFSTANLRVDGAAIRLPLGGAGIRSLEYDTRARAFRVISGAALNNESRDFHVLEWNGNPEASAPLPVIATFPRALKPEGITAAALGDRQVNVVVFDVGRFALLSTR